MRTTIAVTCVLLVACGKPATPSRAPVAKETTRVERIFDVEMSLNFDLLPLQGRVSEQGQFWSGHPWPSRRGSINQRWNAPERPDVYLRSPSAREALTMPVTLLGQLSPAEKYDLYQGRYDYPLRREVEGIVRSAEHDWEGICHGWAAASLNHVEPVGVTVRNPDGLEIPFGSADVKALLSYAYSKLLIRDTDAIGQRCEREDFVRAAADENCDDDLSPVTFHAVVANYLGLRGRSVIADLDRWKEVWNHPVVSYQTNILRMTSARNGGRRGLLRTKLVYVDVVEKNSWDPHLPVLGYLTVTYELEIDRAGNLTGGRWRSRNRPDFLWTIAKAYVFPGYLADVSTLLK
jgi:hypothetical protein